MEPISIILGLAGLTVGGVLTFIVTRKSKNGIVEAAEEKAKAIIKEAEAKGELYLKDKTMEAKDRFYQLKTDHEKHITASFLLCSPLSPQFPLRVNEIQRIASII